MSNASHRQVVVLILCCLLFAISVSAKDPEWREVTQTELSMQEPKVDKNADAEILFWEVRINDSKRTRMIRENYVRVKIFTERGREKFSKFDIPYTKGWRIKDIAARVIRPDGTKVPILEKDIFDREIVKTNRRKVKSKSFAVPNIEPGVIVEYQYREIIKGGGAVGLSLDFQRDFPAHEITFYYKPFNKKKPNYKNYNFDDTDFVKAKKGYYVATRKNVPAYTPEPFMPPSKMVRPWMAITGVDVDITSVSSRSINFVVQDPNNPRQFWGGFGTKRQRVINRFDLQKDKKLAKEAERITAGFMKPEDKVKALYKWAQTELTNLTYDRSLSEDELDEVPKRIKKLSDILKTKKTYASFVNRIFGAMVHSLGIQIAHAYSGDREEMFFNYDMTDERFIHMAGIGVRYSRGWKFYDPGTPYLRPGELLWNEQNMNGILVMPKGASYITTPYTDVDQTKKNRKGTFKLDENGTLKGDVEIELHGNYAQDFRGVNFRKTNDKRASDYEEEIKEQFSTATVSNVSVMDFDDHYKPVKIKYSIEVPNYALKTGKRFFIQPGFFEHGKGPRFASNDRKFDVVFDYGWANNDDIVIDLPAGYALDNPDAPTPIFDSQKIGRLDVKMKYEEDKNRLVYSREFYFGKGARLLFPVSAYSAVKKMFDEFHKNDTLSLSLKQQAAE